MIRTSIPGSTPRCPRANARDCSRTRLLTHALTLDEKVAQLGSVWLTDAADDFAPTLEAGPRAAADVTDGLG